MKKSVGKRSYEQGGMFASWTSPWKREEESQRGPSPKKICSEGVIKGRHQLLPKPLKGKKTGVKQRVTTGGGSVYFKGPRTEGVGRMLPSSDWVVKIKGVQQQEMYENNNKSIKAPLKSFRHGERANKRKKGKSKPQPDGR